MKSIFVSSTFRDMNFERDVLNRRIAPKLNYRLAQYSQTVRILDLRWGVDTTKLSEEEATKRVLASCFDAIDNCKPYMIILLGDRYGYIPEGYDVSVTHMEIIRGLLERTDADHVYIYLRETDYSDMPESLQSVYTEQETAARERLERLKTTLTEQYPDRCRCYRAKWSEEEQCPVSEDFEKMVLADLEADMLRDWQNIVYLSELQKQLCENEELLGDHVRFSYSDTERLTNDVIAVQDLSRPYGIIGDGGEGKSVYLSLLCSALCGKGQKTNILFCGENAFSSSVRNAAEALLHLLYEASGKDYDYEKSSALSYEQLISRLKAECSSVTEKCYFILDAVDKCEDGMLTFIEWCARFLSDQVQIVFSSRMTDELERKQNSFVLKSFHYDRAAYGKMATCILKEYGKSVAQPLIETTLKKAENPLQLRLLLLRLLDLGKKDFDAIRRAGGDMDAINCYLSRVIAESPSETDRLILSYQKSLLDESKHFDFDALLLNLLTFSVTGMYEDDIRRAFEIAHLAWVELDYLDFLARYSFFVRVRENGRLDLSHAVIRETLAKVSENNRDKFSGMIALALSEREKQDATTVRSFFSVVYNAEEPKLLAEFVTRYAEDYHSAVGNEIKRRIQRMYFDGRAAFLMDAATQCYSVEKAVTYASVVTSALNMIDGYYSEDTICDIAYVAMRINIVTASLNASFAQSELSLWESFLIRNHVSEEKISRFLSCFQKEIRTLTQDDVQEESPEELLQKVRGSNIAQAVEAWNKLLFMTSKMANDESAAEYSEEILSEMLSLLEKGEYSIDDMTDTLAYAFVYFQLGIACQTQRKWEEALNYMNKSAAIFRRIYQQNPSPDNFQMLRERLRRMANACEVWAIEEDGDSKLWERTLNYYRESYDMELTAIAQGIEEREVIRASLSICGFGSALIRMGRVDEGIEKYREFVALIKDITERSGSLELYIEITENLVDCFYRLVGISRYEDASLFTDQICRCVTAVAQSDDRVTKENMGSFVRELLPKMNAEIEQAQKKSDINGELTLSLALRDIYVAFLPMAPYEIRVNIIIISCNIGGLLLFVKNDPAGAYDVYKALLELVRKEDLAAPDENGKHMERANSRLVDAYARCIMCAEKLGRMQEADQLLDEADDWASLFIAHIDSLDDDKPMLFYRIFQNMTRFQSVYALRFLDKAWAATRQEGYDRNAHHDTVRTVKGAMKQFRRLR